MQATLVQPPVAQSPSQHRLASLDLLRGVAVAGMLVVNNPGIRDATPSLLRHSAWNGFTLADAIFPVFLFAAGTSLAFSRRAADPRHAAKRVAILFLLGVGLSTLKYHHLSGASGVLQRVALAYGVAWVVLRAPQRFHVPICAALLASVWAAFTFVHPHGVVAGSWSPGTNLADFVDRHVLGSASSEGVLGTFTAAVNVVGGAVAGRWLKDRGPERFIEMLGAGASLAVLGLAWSVAVPINKYLWTPSYTVFTLGLSCAGLALIHRLVDAGSRRLPRIEAMGANPLAVYVLITAASYTVFAPVRDALTTPLAAAVRPAGASMGWALMVVAVAGALATWLRSRRIFIRV